MNTNFTAIGQLVTEARNLLDSVKGGAIRTMQTQFDALKEQFTDKLSSVNTDLAKFVSQQKTNVNSIFSEPDKRYQVLHTQQEDLVVSGSRNFWYPVVIRVPAVMTNLSISRFTHADHEIFGRWNGSVTLDMRVCSRYWGGINSILAVERYQIGRKSKSRFLPDADIPFIGRLADGLGPHHMVIWLRGETTYKLASDWGNVKFEVHDDGVPFAIEDGYRELDARPVSDGVHMSVPNTGYVRGE
ncbi:hypothetical protein BH582_19445 [Vibrio sp. 10N.222.47.A9]|uniref:hypothetical protein n=1 Tax=Vibrio sp. 10N.222.47.A9 TaxID=1903178 RepID=UPI000976AA83|nr:hypothetical protein [Vibrio sp. 10N.222.47.A9]OMO28293.1 hypothetical protein BH582_19445 [Vibrio sp. 10N.222.47.A9]